MKYALLSVSDKTGIESFARALVRLGYRLLSSGGTAKYLRQHNVDVQDVSDFTGQPEILDGRVKTLHPRIHGGILFNRSLPHHVQELLDADIPAIDIVAVNLYPFHSQLRITQASYSDAVELIDIGGPAMLRAAAKSFQDVLAIVDPDDYSFVAERLAHNAVDMTLRQRLAQKVFRHTARYDAMVAESFTSDSTLDNEVWSRSLKLDVHEVASLRYGENPHQKGGWFRSSDGPEGDQMPIEQLHGKELSYNNLLDLEAALRIVRDLGTQSAMTIVKHNNPSGVAAARNMQPRELFIKALASDPKSAFGGIVASNVTIDLGTAQQMHELFLEVIAAPDFTADALETLRQKKNVRLIKVPNTLLNSKLRRGLQMVSCLGGYLIQESDAIEPISDWTLASQNRPNTAQMLDMEFANTVCAHVKSNAIVIAHNGQTIGIGAGQMSRIDAIDIALRKTREFGFSTEGAVVASDAFFPFSDAVQTLSEAGIKAIVQPGGSMRDQESIDLANHKGIVMMLSHRRHFRHC